MIRRLLPLLCLGCADPHTDRVVSNDLMHMCPAEASVLRDSVGELQIQIKGRGEIRSLLWTPGAGSRLYLELDGTYVEDRPFDPMVSLSIPYLFRRAPVVPSGEGATFVTFPGGHLDVVYRSGEPTTQLPVYVVGVLDTDDPLSACTATWSEE
jgi:hypothetical protein